MIGNDRVQAESKCFEPGKDGTKKTFTPRLRRRKPIQVVRKVNPASRVPGDSRKLFRCSTPRTPSGLPSPLKESSSCAVRSSLRCQGPLAQFRNEPSLVMPNRILKDKITERVAWLLGGVLRTDLILSQRISFVFRRWSCSRVNMMNKFGKSA